MIKFKTEEAAVLVDALNGIRRSEGITCLSHLYNNVMDAIAIDELDKKWGIDREELRAKLLSLTEIEAEGVLERVYAFWNAAPHTHLESALGDAELLEEVA